MKKLIFICVLIGLPFILSAKKKSKIDNYVEVKPTLFVAIYETTNAEYSEFLKDIIQKCTPETYEAFRPDSSLWKKSFVYSFNEPWVELYNSHPGFGNYPVVNVSKEAIEEYCKWKTKKFNSNQNRIFKKVIFRLPTEKEWLAFSSPIIGQRLPWNGDYPYIIKSDDQIIPLANIKVKDFVSGHHNYGFDRAMTTTNVGNYKCNRLGLYDIIGNIAELTNDNKIKGGSWDNTLDESYIDLSQSLSAPDPRVGFRLVMEIIEK